MTSRLFHVKNPPSEKEMREKLSSHGWIYEDNNEGKKDLKSNALSPK